MRTKRILNGIGHVSKRRSPGLGEEFSVILQTTHEGVLVMAAIFDLSKQFRTFNEKNSNAQAKS